MIRRNQEAGADLISSLSEFLDPALLSAGQHLYRAGDPAMGIYLLEKGRIGLSSPCRAEKEAVASGALLGVAATLCGQPYHETAVALVDSRVSFIPRESFLGVLERDFTVCLRVLEILSLEINCCYGELRKLAVPPVRARNRGLHRDAVRHRPE